jgi:hypothetical protein
LGVVLTCTFWALFFVPGYALVRRLRLVPQKAGVLYTLGAGYAASLCLASPLSLLCYGIGAPLWVWSGACGLGVVAGLWVLISQRAYRALWPSLRTEPPLAVALLLGLLWLQGRHGGWLDGDATFHVGRMRVLLQHGFTNRDIYLSEYHFQHVYHSNLLFPVYASAAQWTHQTLLCTWFWTEPWAKLMVAAGHYVFAYALLRQRLAAWLTALTVVIANAGETYTLYPNTLCVGFLLPMLLGLGLSMAARRSGGLRSIAQLAGLSALLAQIHALYAVYAALLLAPVWLVALALGSSARERWFVASLLASLSVATPFVVVSAHGFRSERAITSAPDQSDAEPPPTTIAGVVPSDQPPAFEPVALAAGGGHLEKVLELVANDELVFNARRMGGRSVVLFGFFALALAWLVCRQRRWAIASALFVALALAAVLFTTLGTSLALRVLRSPFVVARMSTLLSTLLIFGVCASVSGLVASWVSWAPRAHVWLPSLAIMLLAAASTQLLGQAPTTFGEHVAAALRPSAERHARLDMLQARQALLEASVPRGSTVLATARFARQVVMLHDCYVLVADRGHTGIVGIDKRRRDAMLLNDQGTAWAARAALVRFYRLTLVVFEHRWQRRYRWAAEHGQVVASAAGLDVVSLRP